MSLIVLNSKGQDPAEFENHFGRGIKLPQNAELCLVGSNINFKQNGNDETTIHEGNDTFVVQYGNVDVAGENETGAFKFKIDHGTYKNFQLGGIIDNALLSGGLTAGSGKGNAYNANIPVSPLVGGIQASYNTTSLEMEFTAQRFTIGRTGGTPNEMQTNRYANDQDANESFFASMGTFENNINMETGQQTNAIIANPITRWGVDHTFAEWLPPNEDEQRIQKTSLCILNKYPIWTHSLGAAPLLPDGGLWGGGGGSGNQVNDYWMNGHHWLFDPILAFPDNRDKLPIYMGGIVSNKRVGMTGWSSRYEASENNTVNQQDFNNWANGGVKYDIWWEIKPNDALQNWTVEYFYHPMNTTRWDYTNKIKFGEGQLLQNGSNQISLIPKNGKCGNDANAPVVPTVADQDKFIWEGRYSNSPTVTAPRTTSTSPATLNGNKGYVVVTDGGDFDIYKHLPLFQGANVKKPRPMLPGTDVTIKISSIRHQNTERSLMSIFNGSSEAIDGATGTVVIAGDELPFRDVHFAFSPLRELSRDISQFVDNKFRVMADRYSNIARTIGFREDSLHSIPKNSTVALESDFPAPEWNESNEVIIVQLPNLPIDGALGGGSTVWGGSNDACILGIAPIRLDNDKSDSTYNEPSNENWIKLKNLSMDSLNQLKVKLTDTTGRKINNLAPNSTIWIKIRQGMEDRTLKGGDGPKCYKQSADNFYNNYT